MLTCSFSKLAKIFVLEYGSSGDWNPISNSRGSKLSCWGPGVRAYARTSPVALISGLSCGWLRSRPTNLVRPVVSALSWVVSVPAAAAAAARSAASSSVADVSRLACPAPGACPAWARKLSSSALSARTSAASESTRRWSAGCCPAACAPGASSAPSAAITATRCRVMQSHLPFPGDERAPGTEPGARDGRPAQRRPRSARSGKWEGLGVERSAGPGVPQVRRPARGVAARRSHPAACVCEPAVRSSASPRTGTGCSERYRAVRGSRRRAAPRCARARSGARRRAPATPHHPRGLAAPTALRRGTGSGDDGSSFVRSRPAYGLGYAYVRSGAARVRAQPLQHPPVVTDRIVTLRRLDNLNHVRQAHVPHDPPEWRGSDRAFADPLVAVQA